MHWYSITRFVRCITAYFITVLLYMVVTRHVLFLFINHSHMDDGFCFADIVDSIGHGLKLDGFAACYICILPFMMWAIRMFYPRFCPHTYLIVYNAVVSIVVPLIILSNASLFYFWDALLDVSALTFLNDPSTAFASVSVGYMIGRLAIWMVLSTVMYLSLIWSVRRCIPRQKSGGKLFVLSASLTTLIVAGLIFIGIRGLGTRPMNPADGCFSDKMFYNHMAINPVMNMIFSATHTVNLVKKYHQMSDGECLTTVDPMMPNQNGETEILLNTNAPDILLIIAESLTATTLPSLYPDNKYAVATGLDSLAYTGIFFTRQYCDSYQTDQAIPALLNGVHILSKIRPFREETRMKHLPSLASSLTENGYTSQFVYGGDVHYMNMYSYLQYTGYEKIVSGHDFPKSEAVSRWGIPDGVMFDHMYDIMLKERNDSLQRHFYTILTISSHNPFDVPYKSKYDGRALNAYAYTDRSITDFVNRLHDSPMWDNLLIIIAGDHGPHEHAKTTPNYSHTVLMMLGGAVKEPRRIDAIVSQHDLPATLLAQLGLPHDHYVMSRNVMSDTYTYPSAINTFDDGFTFVDDTGVTIYDNKQMKPIFGDDSLRIVRAKAFQQQAAIFFDSLK